MTNPFTLSDTENLDSYTTYDTKWENQGYSIGRRKSVYARMPNIERVRIEVEGYLHQNYYLRPTLKAIHLDFRIYIDEDRDGSLGFLHKEAFLAWFTAIENLLKDPESQLEELHIQFLPEVNMYLCVRNAYIVNYDRYGPIYEDDDWAVKTDTLNPSAYFFLCNKESWEDLECIGNALLKLLAMRNWKAITLPYHFPSAGLVADLYPFTTFTDEIEEATSRHNVLELIYRFHKEHRQTKN